MRSCCNLALIKSYIWLLTYPMFGTKTNGGPFHSSNVPLSSYDSCFFWHEVNHIHLLNLFVQKWFRERRSSFAWLHRFPTQEYFKFCKKIEIYIAIFNSLLNQLFILSLKVRNLLENWLKLGSPRYNTLFSCSNILLLKNVVYLLNWGFWTAAVWFIWFNWLDWFYAWAVTLSSFTKTFNRFLR